MLLTGGGAGIKVGRASPIIGGGGWKEKMVEEKETQVSESSFQVRERNSNSLEVVEAPAEMGSERRTVEQGIKSERWSKCSLPSDTRTIDDTHRTALLRMRLGSD